jgi:hypothetical protein
VAGRSRIGVAGDYTGRGRAYACVIKVPGGLQRAKNSATTAATLGALLRVIAGVHEPLKPARQISHRFLTD